MHFDVMDIMLPAFCECLVLVGIHSYLGIHVIKRQVIFVDLALAQIAALGTTVAFLFGILPKTEAAFWFSLGFTFIGAAIFSISRLRRGKIPQEAIIGLVYALAASLSILVIDKAPHGAEHIKEMLSVNILWVKWSTIGKAALVYSVVGVFHYLFRDKFLLISNHPEKAYQQGVSVRFWDFLFYLTFGIVITHSVGTAGVLMVFVFLIVPAITSIMITDKLWQQLLIGWGMGVAVSVIGLYISYIADLPSGPTVVSFYGVALLLVAVVLYIIKAHSRSTILKNVGFGTALALLIILVFVAGGRYTQGIEAGHKQAGLSNPASTALGGQGTLADLSGDELSALLDEHRDQNWLKQAFFNNDDDFVQLAIVQRLLEIDEKMGGRRALELLETTEFSFVREQVSSLMEKRFGQNSGYDPNKESSDSQNQKALAAWKKQLEK